MPARNDQKSYERCACGCGFTLRRARKEHPRRAITVAEQRKRTWLIGLEEVMPRPWQSCCLKVLANAHYFPAADVPTKDELVNIDRAMRELIASNNSEPWAAPFTARAVMPTSTKASALAEAQCGDINYL